MVIFSKKFRHHLQSAVSADPRKPLFCCMALKNGGIKMPNFTRKAI